MAQNNNAQPQYAGEYTRMDDANPIQATPIAQPANGSANYGAPKSEDVVPPRGDVGFYDRIPRRVVCQFCNHDVTTVLSYQTGTGTHLVAFGTCIIGCIPCCLIPYWMDSMKDAVHVCPNCQRPVGKKQLL